MWKRRVDSFNSPHNMYCLIEVEMCLATGLYHPWSPIIRSQRFLFKQKVAEMQCQEDYADGVDSASVRHAGN